LQAAGWDNDPHSIAEQRTRIAESDMVSPALPDLTQWRLREVAALDEARARRLENPDSADNLLQAVVDRLVYAIDHDEVRFGRESHCRGGRRIVIQFPVGDVVFDWFFNSRTGYRAHFWASPAYGLLYSDRLIAAVRLTCRQNLADEVSGRDFVREFEDAGLANISRAFMLESLVPTLSKLWVCTKRIRRTDGVDELPLNVGGEPKIILPDTEWGTMYRDEADAWIDVKGAFVGVGEPYQIKDPHQRARTLHHRGTA
jgi:hypothetical protein